MRRDQRRTMGGIMRIKFESSFKRRHERSLNAARYAACRSMRKTIATNIAGSRRTRRSRSAALRDLPDQQWPASDCGRNGAKLRLELITRGDVHGNDPYGSRHSSSMMVIFLPLPVPIPWLTIQLQTTRMRLQPFSPRRSERAVLHFLLAPDSGRTACCWMMKSVSAAPFQSPGAQLPPARVRTMIRPNIRRNGLCSERSLFGESGSCAT